MSRPAQATFDCGQVVGGQAVQQRGGAFFDDDQLAMLRFDEPGMDRVVDHPNERVEEAGDVEQADASRSAVRQGQESGVDSSGTPMPRAAIMVFQVGVAFVCSGRTKSRRVVELALRTSIAIFAGDGRVSMPIGVVPKDEIVRSRRSRAKTEIKSLEIFELRSAFGADSE